MNKKGIFSPALLVILIIVLGYSFYVLVISEIKDSRFTKKIGGIQSEIIDLYQEAEKISFYVDQSAKQVAYNSIYDLGENGGFFGEGCGKTKEGYAIWVSKERTTCYPLEFEIDFMSYFKENLNNLFKLYPERSLLGDNYDIVFKDNKIVGSSKTPFKLTKGKIPDNSGKEKAPFLDATGAHSGALSEDAASDHIIASDYIIYSFDSSFEVLVNYDFNDFKIIKNKVNALIFLCETSVCFESRMEKDDFTWNIRDSDNYVLFDVITNKKLFHKPVVIKFALEYTK